MHLSQKNASAAFEQLNRCLNDVKGWMSTSKLKLNPDETVFQLISWPVHSALLTWSRICVCGSIQIFPCPNIFGMFAKVVL